NLAQTGVSAVSQGAGAIAETGIPGVDLSEAMPNVNADRVWQEIRAEGRQLLRDTDANRSERIAEGVEGVTEEIDELARGENLARAEQALDDAIARLSRASMSTARASAKQEVVDVLVKRTDMSRREAQRT